MLLGRAGVRAPCLAAIDGGAQANCGESKDDERQRGLHFADCKVDLMLYGMDRSCEFG